MLGIQGVIDREARRRREPDATVAGLIGFGKTEPASSGSTPRHARRKRRIASATQPCLGGFTRYKRGAPTGAARLPCRHNHA